MIPYRSYFKAEGIEECWKVELDVDMVKSQTVDSDPIRFCDQDTFKIKVPEVPPDLAKGLKAAGFPYVISLFSPIIGSETGYTLFFSH